MALEGTDYEGDLELVIEGADDLSQPLGELGTDGLLDYRSMGTIIGTSSTMRVTYPTRASTQSSQYVSGLSSRCGYGTFGGLSKQDLEQAVRTYGYLRSLNITGASMCSIESTNASVCRRPSKGPDERCR